MANIWKQFEDLLKKDVRQVAKIISTDGETSTVELLSGDCLKVRGTGPVNGMVYIEGGEVKQQAPNLQRFDMVLY